ncbi:MAG: Rrf2 family transcriptional regulator [Coriobacteriales bacterium]|jgi:Rrf2 family protein|nr:Rrf2 family transcriptional regulator [Coriobacteriales bacterium]
MKVSTKGQHALKIMLDFATHANDGYIRLRDVADRQGLSKAYLEQIMVLLNKGDFFKTARGHQGGYRLAESPASYTLGDILRVTEGDLAIVDEERPGDASDTRVATMVSDVWDNIANVITSYLDSKTLQDILDEHREEDAYDFVI